MNDIKLNAIALMLGLVFIGCSGDDDTPPAPVNEEEVITTVQVNLVAEGDVVTLKSVDLDGDGPNEPVITVSGDLTAGRTYVGSVEFLNETEIPADDITTEVVEEGVEHQVFFVPGSSLDVTTSYGNNDANGNPIGTQFSLQTGAPSAGPFTVVLRHEPNKPNNGTLGDAGGETDVSATFDLTIVE